MYIYIACSPYRRYYRDSSFANLLIANTNSFSNLDDLVYTILAPTPAKPAKITPAIRCTAAHKAKKLAKKEGLRRSKYIASGNAGRYTTNSGLIVNKDDNNAYNRAYVPPTKTEEKKEGSSGNNNSINGSTSNSADKGKGGGTYEYSEGTLRYKDILLCKR
ncbi:hypothetical protein P8C59_006237 [Phyllachora maydis]|uniref:Uncharacterized protein n=1 Tax=Phyllachora maydis TaxID=1825666 RepID=A0AAD9I7T8_9PEZI|nr:hypothetical protein P8C59_006237 [Phyllachora maydis]